MILLGSYTSPFARKVRVALLEKGIPFEFQEDLPWESDSQTTRYNPLGKVPILRDDEGGSWYNSPVIVQFLETLENDCHLIPKTGRASLEVLQLEALADGLCEAGVAIVLERRRDAQEQSAAWVERQTVKLKAALASVEEKVAEATQAGRESLHPSGFGLADISVGVVLDWLDYRLDDLIPPPSEALAAYRRRLAARPSFAETLPPPL